MTTGKTYQNLTQTFKKSTTGNVTIATALLLPLLFGVAGVAFDYTRIADNKTKANNALDAAVLWAGSNLSKGMEPGPRFTKEFESAFEANYFGLTGEKAPFEIKYFNVDENTGEVSAGIDTNITTSFLRVFGYDDVTIASDSTAIFKQTDAEVTMMLDVTGSMSGSKIASLKTAASSAINILLDDLGKKTTRVALVPYSQAVRISPNLAETVTNGAVQIASNAPLINGVVDPNFQPADGCVTERIGANSYKDVSYKISPVSSDSRARGCDSAMVVPLTNNKNDLLSGIRGLRASGVTAGHIGISWTYYTLSEQWNDFWENGSNPQPYSDKVQKIAILMTDGNFNTAYAQTSGTNAQATNNSSRAAESTRAALRLCEDMKALKAGEPGISIYSVAFQAPRAAQQLLRSCANEDTDTTRFYYAANDGQQLESAFKAIANSIKQLRLSQ